MIFGAFFKITTFFCITVQQTITVTILENIVIQTDESLLELILINLLCNALETTDKTYSTVEIRACYDQQDLLIEGV